MIDMKEKTLEHLLEYVRPAVRNEHPYIVGKIPDVRIKLNQNESPYDLPEDLKQELVDAFFHTPCNRYPSEQPDELCAALAQELDWPVEGILVGNGSNELTYTFGQTFIEKGTPVLLPRPMFALYEKVVALHDGRLISVGPRPDLTFDTEAILAAIEQEQPALVVITTPNNPTGRAMTIQEVEAIVQAAPGFVVVDEAYVEFTREVSARTILDVYPNLILLRTFSKAFGLAGMRLGYVMAHPAIIAELLKVRLPFMVDRLAEMTALALLKRPALRQERIQAILDNTQHLFEGLQAVEGVEIVPSQANFFLFKTPLDPRVMMDKLAGTGILVRNMGGYSDLKGYLRVNTGTLEENQAFLVALKKALS